MQPTGHLNAQMGDVERDGAEADRIENVQSMSTTGIGSGFAT